MSINVFKALKESGRSMVEILGVLAIVGILSIGAVAGFNYGIFKYHLNSILHDLNVLSVAAISDSFMERNIIGTAKSPEDFAVKTEFNADYTVVKKGGREFIIEVYPVTQKLCETLLDKPPFFVVSATVQSEGGCSDKTKMAFLMNTDLTDENTNPDDLDYCDASKPCAGCQECSNGVCQDSDEKCEGGVCQNGSCSCFDGYIKADNGACKSCTSSTFKASPEECRKCSNRLPTAGNQCYSCGAMYWLNAKEEDCARCPSHVYFGTAEQEWGICGFCWVSEEPHSTKAQCDRCSNRYFDGTDDLNGYCRIYKGIVSDDRRSCLSS